MIAVVYATLSLVALGGIHAALHCLPWSFGNQRIDWRCRNVKFALRHRNATDSQAPKLLRNSQVVKSGTELRNCKLQQTLA